MREDESQVGIKTDIKTEKLLEMKGREKRNRGGGMERKTERGRERDIYIYIERERESERERETGRIRDIGVNVEKFVKQMLQ